MDSPAPKSGHQSNMTNTDTSKPFSVSINLGSISPEKVVVKIKDRKMTVSGEHIERLQDENGAIKFSFHRFSNQFDLPPGVEYDSLTFTVLDNQTMKIEADDLQLEDETCQADGIATMPTTPSFNTMRPSTPSKSFPSKPQSILKKSLFSSPRNGPSKVPPPSALPQE